MASYLAEKYAYLLTKEDTQWLFRDLHRIYGSLSKAARKANVQRKTIYDWSRTRDVKISTKVKILEALMKAKPDYTLWFILKRSEDSTSDILHIVLTRIFERATMEGLDGKAFVAITRKFERLKQRHAGMIFGYLDEEVSDMSRLIREKAKKLNVTLPPIAIETLKSTEVLELLPTIVRLLPEKVTLEERLDLATKFCVPIELVKVSEEIIQCARAPYMGKSETAEIEYPAPTPTADVKYKLGFEQKTAGLGEPLWGKLS